MTTAASLSEPDPAWMVAERYQRYLPEAIEVTNSRELLTIYPAGLSLDEVLAEIVADYRDEPSYRGLDLAVWRNGYLAAAIRQGRDGGPVLTRFDFEW